MQQRLVHRKLRQQRLDQGPLVRPHLPQKARSVQRAKTSRRDRRRVANVVKPCRTHEKVGVQAKTRRDLRRCAGDTGDVLKAAWQSSQETLRPALCPTRVPQTSQRPPMFPGSGVPSATGHLRDPMPIALG